MKWITKLLLACIVSVSIFSSAMAEIGEVHKMVIQVSSADKKVQAIALKSAEDLQKHFSQGEIKIEVVAYGPGLSLLVKNKKNKLAKDVSSLAQSDIIFSACKDTIKMLEKKTGKSISLIEGVKVVPVGVARILWLQEKGYSYLRP